MSQFTLALNTSTIRPASLMDKIRIAGETGYEAIELWNDDLTAYEEQNGSLTDVKRALDDYGLPVTTVHRPARLVGFHRRRTSRGNRRSEAAHGASRPPSGQPTAFASPPRGIADLQLGGPKLP